VLAEFGAELLVEAVGPTRSKRWTMRELLPDAFTGELLR
jgi:cytidine deaminase